MECAAPVKDKGYEEIPYGSKPAGIPLLHFSKHTIRFCECMDLLDGLKMKVDPIDKPSNHDCGHHRSNSDCRFVKDVLQIKEKRKGPVKGRASLKDGWENGCKPVHGRLAEL